MKTKKYIILMIGIIIVSLLGYFYFDYRSAMENEKHNNILQHWYHPGEFALQTDTLSDTIYTKEYCDSIINDLPEPVRTVVRNALKE